MLTVLVAWMYRLAQHRTLAVSQQMECQVATRVSVWQVNLAVGGDLPGVSPGPDTPFPQTLLMDYVRVYKCVPFTCSMAWRCSFETRKCGKLTAAGSHAPLPAPLFSRTACLAGVSVPCQLCTVLCGSFRCCCIHGHRGAVILHSLQSVAAQAGLHAWLVTAEASEPIERSVQSLCIQLLGFV